MTTDGAPGPRGAWGFVSATFSRDVALSMLEPAGAPQDGVLYRQRTPTPRFFMSFLETEHMNRHYLEAEALLIDDPEAPFF